ncbi:MAG: alkaline phosphatase family protein [Bacteroidetes bacterium]|nr:alkaline phosphatase family protein [Bacteroidota bacterium]
MQTKFYSFILLTFFTLTLQATQDRKVLIIGIDGTRSDALQQANVPNLDALIANGLYTYDAWHCGITVSGPSWSTIMTGVWWNKHGGAPTHTRVAITPIILTSPPWQNSCCPI